MTTPTVGSLLYAFFQDHLKAQKGLSNASVKSYRDGLRLFLDFVARDTQRKLTKLTLEDLTADRVCRFLNTLEQERANHTRTRNQRLSTLHTFFEYIGSQVPEMLAEAERVAATPMKRVPPPETFFLERDEIDTMFTKLPSKGRFALRDRTLLLFLYNTGARVQEVAELCVSNLALKPQPRVHLHGKGNKWRVCPLWTQTASLLEQLLEQRSIGDQPKAAVFASNRGQALTRYGIFKVVRRQTEHLRLQRSDGKRRRVSPHVFRHYLPFRTMSCTGTPAQYFRQIR